MPVSPSSLRWSSPRLRHMSAPTRTGRSCSTSCATCAAANLCRATTRSTEQIAEALADADTETVKAVRDYERKFGHRQSVLHEAARVLPTAQVSAGEERAREDKAASSVRATRIERTAPDPPE